MVVESVALCPLLAQMPAKKKSGSRKDHGPGAEPHENPAEPASGEAGASGAPPPETTKDPPEPDSKAGDPDAESGSESDSGSEQGDGAAPAQDDSMPKFKSRAELRAWEAELKEAALADAATIKRLEEVRARREKAKAEREMAEKAQAEEEARRKAEAEAAEEARQRALSQRPRLELPGPKDVKTALMKLQECASDDFLKKHGLKGAGGNKLAKIKNAEFQKIFDDFQENGDVAELHKYIGT